MKPYCIIINPAAAKGAAKKALPTIENLLNTLGVDYDLFHSDYPGHTVQIAQEAGSQGYSTVVAVGGDGTVNEAINGIMNAINSSQKAANLAVLPVGRGNDFSYGVGIPQDLESACRLLVEGKTRPIDIGLVKGGDYPEGRYFGNGIGIGFDTVVGFEAAKLPSFIGGIPGYIIAALKTIFLFFNAPLIKLDIDGTVIEQPCLLVSVMNGRRMGGSFMFAPSSEVDDNQLNLCIAEGMTRLQVLSVFPKVMAGTQADHPKIKMPTGREIKIEALSGTLPVHADGETICVTGQALDIQVLHKALNLVCS